MELVTQVNEAGDRVHAFAVDRVSEADATTLLARRLATVQPVMKTHEVADWLRMNRLRFSEK